jgi:transposase
MEHGLFLASGIVIHHHARKSTPQLEIEWVTFGEHRWVISRECRSLKLHNEWIFGRGTGRRLQKDQFHTISIQLFRQ